MGYRKSMNVVPAAVVRACWSANLCVAILLAVLPGCRRNPDQGSAAADKVTVYCSVDESFARGILDGFKATSGVDVAVVFDSEAGKTTGLVNRIRHEADAGRPRADVFWSSELFNTILLARRGLLESYDSPAAADIPERYRDTQHRWTALAVRGRVIAFKSDGNETIALPTAWEDLAKPEFAKATAFPNPLFGTTRGHLAAMFALWGPQRGRSFLTRIRENGVLIVDGNSAA
ncbi:MAG: ABC transporter substrate-binding protein, partial [Planctomycetes bacterium]|nr:ABC transporter substrate-binding protein [Planctomycetota bacterium]